jgi:hypothetical protein
MKRCRYCRSEGGELVLQPASDDYRPGRRWYKAQGQPTSYYHAACLADFEAFEARSRARYEAEREATFAELRRAAEETAT